MASGLKIYGTRSALDEMVSSAGRFTASDSGSAAHLRYILFEAKDGILSVTAESNFGSIQFCPEDVTVEGDGRMLVRHNMLYTALSVFEASQSPVLEHDPEKNKLHIFADNTDTDIVTSPIGDSAVLPTIGSVNKDNGFEVAPEDFIEWYGSLAPFRNIDTIPAVMGVHMRMVGDGVIQGIGTNGRVTASFHTLKASVVGEGVPPVTLEHEGMSRAMDFARRGARVNIHMNEADRRLHVIVHSKSEQLYHIRIPLLNVESNRFPADALYKSALSYASSSSVKVEMIKSDMLQIMRNAANVGALSPTQTDGASRIIELMFSEETFEVQSGSGTDASYQDSRPAVVQPLDVDISAHFSFGLFGSLIETYHDQESPEKIRFGLGAKTDGTISSMVFYYGDDAVKEDGSLPDHFMMVPLVQKR